MKFSLNYSLNYPNLQKVLKYGIKRFFLGLEKVIGKRGNEEGLA